MQIFRLFIHLFSSSLLSTYYVLGSGNRVVSKTYTVSHA